jgi:hypothetical protein
LQQGGANLEKPLISNDMENLLGLFTDAIRHRIKALELENEALKIRLNEARAKLDLAQERLQQIGGDISGLDIETELN